jgi:hypothetical protein
MPEFIQKKIDTGLLTYSYENWVTTNGLKFPTKMQNMGNKTEIFEAMNVSASKSVDDELYVVKVRY